MSDVQCCVSNLSNNRVTAEVLKFFSSTRFIVGFCV